MPTTVSPDCVTASSLCLALPASLPAYRRYTLLALLARSLPGPVARLPSDTLAFISYACSATPALSCCCDDGCKQGSQVLEGI